MSKAQTITPSKVALRVAGREDEVFAGSICVPGTAVGLSPDGLYDPCPVSTEEYLRGALCLVEINRLLGGTLTTSYSTNDLMNVVWPKPGDTVYALIKAGEEIAVGDFLVPEATTGVFVAANGTEARYSLQAEESVSPVGSDGYCECRVVK